MAGSGFVEVWSGEDHCGCANNGDIIPNPPKPGCELLIACEHDQPIKRICISENATLHNRVPVIFKKNKINDSSILGFFNL